MKRLILLSLLVGVNASASVKNPFLAPSQASLNSPSAALGKMPPQPAGAPPAELPVPEGGSAKDVISQGLNSGKSGSSGSKGSNDTAKLIFNSARITSIVDDMAIIRYKAVDESGSGSNNMTPVAATTSTDKSGSKEQSLVLKNGNILSLGGNYFVVAVSADGVIVTSKETNKIIYSGNVDTTDMAPEDIVKDRITVDSGVVTKLKPGTITSGGDSSSGSSNNNNNGKN